jgi:RNA polymerase sigma factor (sigma-70 family)
LAAKSDKRLVELAQRGDTHAIEVLYDRYATAILRYCRSLLRSTQEAEDVQQEVFVTALSALRNGAGPDSFRPWLYRVAHNACISHMRAKRPTLVAVDGELVASATTEPASEEREELRQLLDDLSALPEVQRGALLLREMDGFSYEQVGEVLGLPVTTVRSTIFRARSTLQGLAEARDAKCEEIQAELSELADRRGRRSRRITSHLHVCSECREFRAALRCRPAVLNGYVPALPLGVLASVKASVLGAQGAAGGAGAAVASGTGGFGLLGGAGAGKMVAAAASACALIGGAGTQVGVIGGGSGGATGDATTVVVADAGGASSGSKAPRGGRTGSDGAGRTAHSHVTPAAYQDAISHHAPGTVVWRPANGEDAVTGAPGSHAGHGSTHGPGHAGAATAGAHHAGSLTNTHWGAARPGGLGQYAAVGVSDDGPDAESDDDDRSDRSSGRGDGRRSQSAGSDSSAATSFADSSTGASAPDDDNSTGNADPPAREAEPAREQSSASEPAAAQQPTSDPAPAASNDPAPESPAASSSPASAPADTATPPAAEPAAGGPASDPAAGGTTTSTDPAAAPSPAPNTP